MIFLILPSMEIITSNLSLDIFTLDKKNPSSEKKKKN